MVKPFPQICGAGLGGSFTFAAPYGLHLGGSRFDGKPSNPLLWLIDYVGFQADPL
jgi:hypothetical protein